MVLGAIHAEPFDLAPAPGDPSVVRGGDATAAELTALVDCGIGPAVLVDAAARLRRFNEAAAERFRLACGDVGAPVARLVERFVDDVWVAEIRRALDDGARSEHVLRARDGRWYACTVTPCALPDGRALVIAFADVTESRRSMQRFAWASALFQSAQEAVVAMSPDGTIVGWNRSAETLYGYAAHEVIGHSIDRLVPPEKFDELARLGLVVERGLEVDPFETVRLAKGERRIEVSVRVVPVRGEDGEVVGLLGFSHDVGPLRNAERRLEATKCDLEQRMVRKAAALAASNAALHRQMRERERLTGRLLRVQDEERRRIGRELHDSTGQSLAALSMDLAKLHRVRGSLDDAARRALEDAQALVGQCSKELRTIAYLLHPPLLDETGLASAVQWYADGFAQRSGLAVDVAITPDLGRLGADVEPALFRVLQESLTNVHRHARSPRVSVRLRRRHSLVKLDVVDAGRGIAERRLRSIETYEAATGVGIMGMRERIRQLGGHLVIVSGKAGTTVRAVVPLEPAAARCAPKQMETA